MDNEKTRAVLEKLIENYPRQSKFNDFAIAEDEKQDFLNFLMELHQRRLVDAFFVSDNTCENFGMPLELTDIKITKEGREFMEKKDEAPPVSQTINIQGAAGTVNIAGQDININGTDADRLLEKLLENIEKSDLQPENKKTLRDSIKSMTAAVTPSFLAGLLVESTKSIFSGS